MAINSSTVTYKHTMKKKKLSNDILTTICNLQLIIKQELMLMKNDKRLDELEAT